MPDEEQAQQAPPPAAAAEAAEAEAEEAAETASEILTDMGEEDTIERYREMLNEIAQSHDVEYITRRRKQQRKMNIKLKQKKEELQQLINHKKNIDDTLRYATEEEDEEEYSDDGDPDFDPDFDPEFDYDFNSNNKKKKKLDFDSIPQKVAIYDELLETINEELMSIKNGLDSYQIYLHKLNSFVQLSVIVLSLASSFVQALSSKSYEVIFNDPDTDISTNITNIIDETNEGSIDHDTYSKMVPIITLSISTYSALVISTERHFSFEEREGNVNNLKGLYSELISRIKYHREILGPWSKPDYYKEKSINKEQSWYSLVENYEQEYSHIIDIKRELYTSYEKIVNTGVYDKYKNLFNKQVINVT